MPVKKSPPKGTIIEEKQVDKHYYYPLHARRSEQNSFHVIYITPEKVPNNPTTENLMIDDDLVDFNGVSMGEEFYCFIGELPKEENDSNTTITYVHKPEDFDNMENVIIDNRTGKFDDLKKYLEEQHNYNFDRSQLEEFQKHFENYHYTIVKANVEGFERFSWQANLIHLGFEVSNVSDSKYTFELDDILYEKLANTDDIPDFIGKFALNDDQKQTIYAIKCALESDEILNVFMWGDSGTGKTSFKKAVSGFLGMSDYTVNTQNQTDVNSWWGGMRIMENGETKFVPSALTEHLQNGNVVILFDELNRQSAEVLNALLPVFDDQKEVHLEKFNYTVKVSKGIVFLMSANIGDKFISTEMLDPALIGRIDIWLKFGNLDFKKLEEVSNLEFGHLKHFDRLNLKEIYNYYTQTANSVKKAEINVDVTQRFYFKLVRLLALTGADLTIVSKQIIGAQLETHEDFNSFSKDFIDNCNKYRELVYKKD